MSGIKCHVYFIFLQQGAASWWRDFYQGGLPGLVFINLVVLITQDFFFFLFDFHICIVANKISNEGSVYKSQCPCGIKDFQWLFRTKIKN